MSRLGFFDEWLAATFTNPQGPAVRFSSCFPFQGDTRFVVPPSTLWPPPPSLKVRWKGARFVPLQLIEELLASRPLDEESWRVDGMSRCLVPAGWSQGPFRLAVRSSAAVDRLTGETFVHKTACLEFSPGAGMWALATFSGEETEARWSGPVQAAFRLLADSGLGGERARGWGRFQQPDFERAKLPELILGSSIAGGAVPDSPPQPTAEAAYWLLSLFSPADKDRIQWDGGSYSLLTRSGRVESPLSHGALKKLSRMVAEGSVILSEGPPEGGAIDVAPEGVDHPVYRAGFAVAVAIPLREVPR